MLHSFHLLSTAQYPSADYINWPKGSAGVQLHDDLINYMGHAFFGWLPCAYPARMERARGLDQCGPAVLAGSDAAVLAEIVEGYAKIFSCGPNTLRLEPNIYWSFDAPETAKPRTNFETFNRDETVAKLRQIADWSIQASVDEAVYVAFNGL